MAGLVNSELISMAATSLSKEAFVPGDQAAAAAGGGGAPPMDPAAGGGAPPMDPMAGGGAPPMDPAMAGGAAGGDPLAMLQPMIDQAVQAAVAGQGGGGAGAGGEGGGIKPKIDVNVELMQIKNMLAHLLDNLGVQMPASSMVATQDSLNQMAANPGADPSGAAPGAAPGGGSAIAPIEPMQAAAPGMGGGGEKAGAFENGTAYQPTAADRLAASGTLATRLMGVTGRV